jgi:hypothetical protein
MRTVQYFEAFDHNNKWIGTATLAATQKAGLFADLRYPYNGNENLGSFDEWACRAPV